MINCLHAHACVRVFLRVHVCFVEGEGIREKERA